MSMHSSGKTLQSVDQGVAGQKSDETHASPPCLPSSLEGPSSLITGPEDGNGYKLLPAIEDLQIIGKAFPGRELLACGYPINGTTICMFQWVRHMEHGSVNYIDGACNPTYVVTTDDIDTYLSVEVMPLDNWGRKGELVKCFANSNRKISCDPEMSHPTERTLISRITAIKIQGDANTEKQILEEPSSLIAEPDENKDEDDNGRKLLPTIEGLQIFGEAFPGRELQASGYSINGTTHCFFKWFRSMEDGSVKYIDGANQSTYIVTIDDVDIYLAVEVQPLDDKQRKGELVKCFANSNRKISCDPEMSRHIDKTLIAGQTSYKLHLWTGSHDTWEPATLEIKTEVFSIRNSRTNGVVATEKFSPATVVYIQYENPLEFSITGFGGIIRLLKTESTMTDVSCSRDTIALTLRLFIKRAVERKKDKKKRVLFFTPN